METKNKISIWKDKNAINNVMRWILFGVFLVVAPPLFNIWFRIIVGLQTDFIDYIPDILLAVLAVCCNLINTCIDSSKELSHLLRWVLGIILGIISVGCWGFFFIVRFVPKNYIKEYTYDNILKECLYFATIVIVLCGIIGFFIEIHTAKIINKRSAQNEK